MDIRRIVAAPLWFVSTLMLYELVIYVAGGPHSLGPVLAASTAALVAVDPLHRIWPVLSRPASALPTTDRRETITRGIQSV